MEIIIAARKALDNPIQESSARFCLADAVQAVDRGERDVAYEWALRSLAYSVGIFSPIYKKFNAFIPEGNYSEVSK